MGALELWEIVLIAVAVGLIAIVLFGRRFRGWVVGVPELAASLVLAFATGVIVNVVTRVFNSVNDDNTDVEIGEAIQGQLLLGVPALTLFALVVINMIARARDRQSLREEHEQELGRLRDGHRQELDEVRKVNRQEWQQFVGYELEHLLFAVGTILSLPDVPKRSQWIESTKVVAVKAAWQYVGRVQPQVRACLYGHDETAKMLSPMEGHGLCVGGEEACTRTFSENDPTYRRIVTEHKPFVRVGISEDEEQRENLDHRGFIAYPIQVRGQDTVLGALVVDSAGPDDLDDMVAVGKVRILAALLSAPLFVQNQAGAR